MSDTANQTEALDQFFVTFFQGGCLGSIARESRGGENAALMGDLERRRAIAVHFGEDHGALADDSIDVKDDAGKVKQWSFEMAGPGALRRAGMSRADRGGIKPGDTVTVDGILAKDDTNFGLLKDVKLPDGRVYTIWTGDPNAQ